MIKTAIGHVDCPICPQAAEVKEDKNGHAFIHCPHCTRQTFTRGYDDTDAMLRKRMRPVTVTVTEPNQPEAVPNTTPRAKAEPGTPGPVQAKPVPAAPAPKPKKASWFQPILAGGE